MSGCQATNKVYVKPSRDRSRVPSTSGYDE
jgi:hypothetical protein